MTPIVLGTGGGSNVNLDPEQPIILGRFQVVIEEIVDRLDFEPRDLVRF
jgi:hypothetical protein